MVICNPSIDQQPVGLMTVLHKFLGGLLDIRHHISHIAHMVSHLAPANFLADGGVIEVVFDLGNVLLLGLHQVVLQFREDRVDLVEIQNAVQPSLALAVFGAAILQIRWGFNFVVAGRASGVRSG